MFRLSLSTKVIGSKSWSYNGHDDKVKVKVNVKVNVNVNVK